MKNILSSSIVLSMLLSAFGPGRENEWHAAIFLALLVIPAAYGLIRSVVLEGQGTESLVGHLVSGYLLVAAAPVAVLLDPAAGWTLAALFFASRLLARAFPPS